MSKQLWHEIVKSKVSAASPIYALPVYSLMKQKAYVQWFWVFICSKRLMLSGSGCSFVAKGLRSVVLGVHL